MWEVYLRYRCGMVCERSGEGGGIGGDFLF